MNSSRVPRNPIAAAFVPSQEATRQSVPAKGAFRPYDWAFNPFKPNELDFTNPLQARTKNQNMFAKNEGWQTVKNGMFNPLTGEEPIAGHINFFENPLQQEQTNGQTSAYRDQGVTRVADNMNPIWTMRNPSYQYPYKPWMYVYTNSKH